MDLDDELCLCFHVSKRKIVNYIRVEKPRAASQLSDCYGAGSGCGWCRTYIKHLFQEFASGRQADEDAGSDEPTAEQYAADRSNYVRAGRGTPPRGATPIT